MTKRNRILLLGAMAVVCISTLLLCTHTTTNIVPPIHAGELKRTDYPFNFIVFGDSRPRDWREVWAEKAEGMAAVVMGKIAEESPFFVLHLGDIATRGEEEEKWAVFDGDSAPIREKAIPFFPIIGNHELKGNKERCLENYFRRFPHLQKKRWYEIRCNNVLILCLDSNFGDLSGDENAEQDRWLEGQLSSAETDPTIEFVFVACHHPPYSNAKIHAGDDGVKSHFVAKMKGRKKVKAFFSGHVHSYERFHMEDGVEYIVSGGGGSPRHELRTGDRVRYPDQYQGGELRKFHYCRLTVRRGECLVETVEYHADNKTWTTGDSLTLHAR